VGPVELGLDDPRWRSFVSSCAEAGPFHHPAWATLLARCYGFRPFALALVNAEGTIEAGIPVLEEPRPLRSPRLLSLPFTDVCLPLACSEAARARLAADVAATGRLELHAPLAGPGLVTRVRGVRHVLDLEPDAETLRGRFRQQTRRNVARAEREGAVVRPGETRADLVEIFYELHLRTRRRQGVPVQPRRFFELLWDDLIEPGLGTVFLAYSGPRPIAGAVFLAWNGTVTYKFGASDPAHWRLRPNNLLFWEAIRRACARGDRTLDFGRTELENHGLREFKSGWGAREEPLLYTFAGAAPRAEARRRVAGALGATIRHSPLWVCRAVGEAAYRYAA
jgi:CelD/BcsL family acetyltransferase involved in cellulose biosynthesis